MDSPIAGVSDDENGYDDTNEHQHAIDTPQNLCVLNAALESAIPPEQHSTTEDMSNDVVNNQSDSSAVPSRPNKRSVTDEHSVDAEEASKRLCVKQQTETGEVLTITAKDGTVFSLRKSSNRADNSAQVPLKEDSLLSSSMEQLMREAAQKRTEMEKSRCEVHSARHRSGQLWVDKYAPKSFIHLLSDERCNRSVLQWLKSWDPIVFGKANKSSSIGKGSNNEDAGPSPESQILLLNGPPGIGKTTLVHILARQAGYEPMEINASDERSASSFKTRLEALTETQSINGKNGRPICVILDEIDGTVGSEGQGTVGVLLKVIQGDNQGGSSKKKKNITEMDTEEAAEADADTAENNLDKAGSKRRNKRPKMPLRRPIICICNDLYATPLRPLRKVAQVIKFSPPSSARLIARLQQICKSESIKMDRQAITLLSEIHHADIRACITALQMIAVEPSHDGNVIDASKMRRLALTSARDGGLSSGLFEVWSAIFDQSSGKKNGVLGASNKEAIAREQKDKNENLQCILNAHASDMNIVLNGCHHNYPMVKYTDPHFHKTVACLEALCDADCMQTKIQRHQHYSLMGYQTFAARRIHLACSTSAPPNIEFPHSMAQNAQLERERKNILESVRTSFHQHSTSASGTTMRQTSRILVTELLPSLSSILTPEFRLSNVHVINKEVREQMDRHVAIMRTYGLLYQNAPRVSSSTADSNDLLCSSLRLEPDLEELTRIPKQSVPQLPTSAGLAPTTIPTLESRGHLSQEVMKHLQQMMERAPAGSVRSVASQVVPKGTPVKPLPGLAVQAPPKSMTFGQAGWASASQHKTCRESVVRAHAVHGVKYKFNEGVTNAIKRPVPMRDLI